MSDAERRALTRLCGMGDLRAARKLVALLEREQAVAPGEDPLVPPAETGDPDVDVTLALIDKLMLRVVEGERGTTPDYVRHAGRMLPRPGSPGAKLVGGALHANLLSTSDPRMGWGFEYHYRQVTALAVTLNGVTTLGVARAVQAGDWEETPARHWWEILRNWSMLPPQFGSFNAAENECVPSGPLSARLRSWGSTATSPANTVRLDAALVPKILAYLHGPELGDGWAFFVPHRSHSPGTHNVASARKKAERTSR